MHDSQYVYFNDGKSEDNYALVLKDHGGGFLDLLVLEGRSKLESFASVPRRDKPYEAGDNGGITWHP